MPLVSAFERLTGALWGNELEPDVAVTAQAMCDVDTYLAQDIEDGEAMRRFDEAAGALSHGVDRWSRIYGGSRTFHAWVVTSDHVRLEAEGPTVAQAADACRQLLP